MSHYQHFSMEERERLLIARESGATQIQIAILLGRSRSTISRELKRNNGIHGQYSAVGAQSRYAQVRKRSRRGDKLARTALKETVEELLSRQWSPEQISGRLKMEKGELQISPRTIYRGIEKGLVDVTLKKHLRSKGRRRHGGRGKSKCGHLVIDYTIHDRPQSVERRKQIGHWESDVVRGSKWSGCIATHVERVSRYVLLGKMADRCAQSMTQVTCELFKTIPSSKCLSLTTDHGKEFAGHRQLSANLGCKVYFADPMAPWQRGTNENTNGLLRQFLPKRTSFEHLTQHDVDQIAYRLNHRPRKSLNWKTPHEVFFSVVLLLT